MRTKFRFNLALGVAAGLTLAVVLTMAFGEPSYGGINLYRWLVLLAPASGSGPIVTNKPNEALEEMGPTVLPWLARWSRAEDGRFLSAYVTYVLPHIPPLLIGRLPWRPSIDRNWKAVWGYKALGSVADPAVPGLVVLAKERSNPGRANAALEALCAIGSERAFKGILSLEGAKPIFTRQYLAETFVSRNPEMSDYIERIMTCPPPAVPTPNRKR